MTNNYPSEDFQQAWGTQRTSVAISCQLCDRFHFTSAVGHGDFEEGEMERYQALAEEQPDLCIEDSVYGYIDWGYLDGKQAVVDCPCRKLVPVEEFVWLFREEILEYLRLRSESERGVSQRNADEHERNRDEAADLERRSQRK